MSDVGTIVSLRDVYKSYDDGAVEAVRGISFDIAAGEFVAIMGASGSGKSTILHLMGALDNPDSGSILFRGRDVRTMPNPDLFRAVELGFVFQLHYLLPHLSLLENVMLPLATHGLSSREARERAELALLRVGLGHRVKHLPNRVSGGERQRAAIARAIVTRPPLLLADEPTGNVDSHTEGLILDLFAQLQQELGATLVVVTHNPAVAGRALRTLHIRDGRIATPEQVPAHA